METSNPIPPLTKCVAIKDFKGEQRNDLPFKRGEILTIIDPCNVMYWYVAEKSSGQRGLIPITHVKVHAANKKPPPTPPSDSAQSPVPGGMDVTAMLDHAPSPPLPPKPAATLEHNTKATFIAKTSLTYPRAASGSTNSSDLPKSTHKLPSKSPPALPTGPKCAPPLPGKSTSPPPLYPPPEHPRNSPGPFRPPLTAATSASTSTAPSTPNSTIRYVFNSPSQVPLKSSSPLSATMKTSAAAQSPEGGVASPCSASSKTKHLPPLPHSLVNHPPSVDIDRRPPALLPTEVKVATPPSVYKQSKYVNQKEFVHKSGWFAPSLENVLCKMMYSTNVTAFTSTTTGIYMFVHKRSPTKKYVAKSRTAYHDLVQMFHRLYDKKDERLNALEREIRYNSPDASDWVFRIYGLSSADQLEVEANKRVLENNTLQPTGMNTELKFSSKESFLKFAEEYAQSLRESAKRNVNPIRVSAEREEQPHIELSQF